MFLLIYILLFTFNISSNIGSSFLKDKVFEQEFVTQYGQSLYDVLKNQIQAWVHVLGYKNVTLQQLEIIFSIHIPIYHRKHFFSILENIIINTESKSVSNNNEKFHQLMEKVYKRYGLFYSTEGIFWFIKNKIKLNNKNQDIYYNNNDIHKKLSKFLVGRRVLKKDQINYFNNELSIKSWDYIIYGLILKYYDNREKLKAILDNYPVNNHHKIFIKFIGETHKSSLKNLINSYKKSIPIHPNSSHEIFIILIKYIVNNRKNTTITHKEWIHIFKIMVQYYSVCLEDFNGVGISYFMKAMKILMQKQIAGGLVLENNISLKNFINYINKNKEKIYQWCQEEILNPFFTIPVQGSIDTKNLPNLIKIYKKNWSYKKNYMVEFFSIFINVNILYKYFNNNIHWAPFLFLLASHHNQFHWEQSVYLLVVSYIELITKESKFSKDNQDLLLNYKEQMDFWINTIKITGQVSIYGQFVADKFLNNYRSHSYFSVYINNFYNSIYPNTIQRNVASIENIKEGSKDFGSGISKYDWLILLGIYVLQQEKADISINPQVIQKDNKIYKRIVNNKYSLTRSVLYQWDYIVNNLPSKALESITFLSKILIHLSIKKFRYMVMLSQTMENKTGVANCFSIHPKAPFLLKYKDHDLRLGLLSAIMKQETVFTLLIDGKKNNYFDPSNGSGLFQINFINARSISKKLDIYFSPERLQQDIQYNFTVAVEFLNKLINWIGNKHIVNWIVSYNGSTKILKDFQNLLKVYNISNYNKEIQSLYSPFLISLIPAYVTRHYVLNVLSYLNNNNYFLFNDYENIFIKDTNPWF